MISIPTYTSSNPEMSSKMNGHQLPCYSMNGGDGPQSYMKNSSYQGGALDAAKSIIEVEISKHLDVEHVDSALCIADFGCSTGHNSFPAMQIIIHAINKKEKSPKPREYCVFFNDLVANDFNTLFSSLPAHRTYHALGLPGDFHRRLLPPSSLHFAYSSCSVHWLTKAPAELANRDSPAWNGGRIWYDEDKKEVCDAYLEQFGKDMKAFLEARAVEIVGGGLMALIIPGLPQSSNSLTECTLHSEINLLGSCLVDMAKKGKMSNAKIDSFNLPYYFSTPQEMKAVLERNKSFTIERMEIVNNSANYSMCTVETRTAFYRATHEALLTHHFGPEIIAELFHLYNKKLAASPVFLNNDISIMILLVLKRAIN